MTESSPAPRPRLHPFTAVLIVLALAAAAGLVLAATPRQPRDWMVVGVTTLGFLLAGLVIGGIAYLAGKRSSRAFNTGLSLVLVVFIGLLGWAIVERSGPTKKHAAIANPAPPTNPAAAVPASTPSREEVRAAITELAERVAKDIGDKGAAYVKAREDFELAGGVLPNSLESADDVTARAALLESLRQANAAFQQAVADAPQTLRHGLYERRLSDAQITATVEGFGRRNRLSLYAEIGDTRARMFKAMDQYFALVAKHWGRHKVEGNRFVLDDAGADASLLDTMRDILAAAEREAELARAMSGG